MERQRWKVDSTSGAFLDGAVFRLKGADDKVIPVKLQEGGELKPDAEGDGPAGPSAEASPAKAKETFTTREGKVRIDYEKLNGVQGYHLVQSFKGHEASPELAHRIARELSERLHGGRYQVVISTHLNTNNIHNHIVWNSVSHIDGAKYVSNAKSYYKEVRRISDELCHKYGLSIIHPEQGSKGKSYAEWQAEKKGEPTWRSLVRKVVDAAIQESFTFPQFLDALESQGWAIKFGKHIAVRPPGKERYIRLKSCIFIIFTVWAYCPKRVSLLTGIHTFCYRRIYGNWISVSACMGIFRSME